MAHATYHLGAARVDEAGGVALHRTAEGEIRGQEEPAVAALLHDRLGGAGSNGERRDSRSHRQSVLAGRRALDLGHLRHGQRPLAAQIGAVLGLFHQPRTNGGKRKAPIEAL